MKYNYLSILAIFLFIGVLNAQDDSNRGGNNCVPEANYTPCPRCVYRSQESRDECYMREALNFGKSLNPSRPYGAIVVDNYRNVISCYGVNSASQNVLIHGEIAAFNNCTATYPSPTYDDRNNPGLYWLNQTMYTSAEPCAMCATASIWRGLGRMVYGTSIPDLIKLGSKQLLIRNREVYQSGSLSIFKTGGLGAQNSNQVPLLKEGVLEDECNAAFYTAFGFSYPPKYDSCEDVFSLSYGKCDDHHHH